MEKRKVACYAAGIIGSSFAVNFALKGFHCEVYIIEEDKILAPASIQKVIDSLKNLGALDDEGEKRIWSNIHITLDAAEALSDVSLIQENCPENLKIKREIMKTIDKYAPADAVVASSTSGMSISLIAEGSAHPERCIGAHPFNPPHLIPLVEITKGVMTEDKYVLKAKEIYKAAGKEPVVLNKEKPGFIANRFSHAVLREVMALVNEGVCSLEDADRALVYGPGLRWAVIGQGMVGELGSPTGIREGTKRFAALNESIFRDLENLTTIPEGWADLAEAAIEREKAEMPDFIGHTTADIASFRDKVLIELLKLHHKL